MLDSSLTTYKVKHWPAHWPLYNVKHRGLGLGVPSPRTQGGRLLMLPYLALALSTAGTFANVCWAAPPWQISLKRTRRETPSQRADASAGDFSSDGGKCFDFA